MAQRGSFARGLEASGGGGGSPYVGNVPDTSKYIILPEKMPRWAVAMSIGMVALFVLMLVVLASVITLMVGGSSTKATVEEATVSVSTLQQAMPLIKHYLEKLVNISALAGSVVPQEVFADGYFTDPVPGVQYVDILNGTVRMAYRFAGPCSDEDSAIVVMVHALSSSSVEWIENMNRFGATAYCAVAVDLLGHGNSDPVDLASGGSVQNQALYLLEFMTQAGLLQEASRPVILMGNSFGGSVVMQFHAQYPGFARYIILENPVPYIVAPWDKNATWANITGAVRFDLMVQFAALSLYNISLYTEINMAAIGAGSSCSSTVMAPVMQAYQQVALSADSKAVSDALLSLATLDHRSVFSGLTIPVLLITGSQTGLGEEGQQLSYAKLAEAARALADRQATLHIVGAAAGSIHATHSHLFYTLCTQFLSGLSMHCDITSVAWSQIV